MTSCAPEWAGLWGHPQCRLEALVVRLSEGLTWNYPDPFLPTPVFLGTSVGLVSITLGEGFWNPLTLIFSFLGHRGLSFAFASPHKPSFL